MSTNEPAGDTKSAPAEEGAAADGEAQAEIGWGRAVATGLIVLLVGFGGGVIGANAVLTKALGLTRDARQWIATALLLVVVIVLAWVLRQLQARGWI